VKQRKERAQHFHNSNAFSIGRKGKKNRGRKGYTLRGKEEGLEVKEGADARLTPRTRIWFIGEKKKDLSPNFGNDNLLYGLASP